MSYSVAWSQKALKQARKVPLQDRARIVAAVGALADWPACKADIKPLKNHARQYRLRVGRYRVLFDVMTAVEVIAVEEVRKRDERTY